MTRSEFRRAERQKTPTYNYTEKQIKAMVLAESKRIKDEATKDAVYALTCVFAQALHDEYGFGKNKINNLLSRTMFKFECILDGTVKLDEIREWCEEYGIKFGGD